jgi:hypothetical protein
LNTELKFESALSCFQQDEFAQSTREAFAGQNEAVEAALELHFKEVAALEKGEPETAILYLPRP